MPVLKRFRKLFDPIDLTHGGIYRVLFAFMIPIFLSMAFQLLYTMTDAVIVGQTLSSNEVAGVQDSGSLVFIVLEFAFGCSSGFSVIIARKTGEKDYDGARQSLLIQIILGAVITVVLTALALWAIDPMLGWLHIAPSATDPNMEEVYEAAHTYLLIIFSGLFSQMFYNIVTAALRAMGDAFTPFLFLVFATALNIVLDIVFIVSFHWGVAGAAWATVLTQSLAGLGSWIYAFARYKKLRLHKSDWHIAFRSFWEHLRNGLPLGFQFSILAIGIIIMQEAIISFDIDPSGLAVAGVPAELGYGAANKLNSILMAPLNAIGTAMLSFVGQNHGAGREERIRKGFKAALVIGLASWAFVMTVGLLLTINGAYQYIFLAADKVTPDSIAYGNAYLYVSVPTLVFLMVLFVARNTLQGLEKPLWPFLAGIAELLARSLICLYLPSAVNGGPIDSSAGLGAFFAASSADPMAWLAAGILMAIPVIWALSPKRLGAEGAKLSDH